MLTLRGAAVAGEAEDVGLEPAGVAVHLGAHAPHGENVEGHGADETPHLDPTHRTTANQSKLPYFFER